MLSFKHLGAHSVFTPSSPLWRRGSVWISPSNRCFWSKTLAWKMCWSRTGGREAVRQWLACSPARLRSPQQRLEEECACNSCRCPQWLWPWEGRDAFVACCGTCKTHCAACSYATVTSRATGWGGSLEGACQTWKCWAWVRLTARFCRSCGLLFLQSLLWRWEAFFAGKLCVSFFSLLPSSDNDGAALGHLTGNH